MWWIIGAVIIFLILVFQKFKGVKENWTLALFIILIVFIAFSMTSMIQSGKMKLDSPGAIINSLGVYFGWVGETIFNVWGVGKDAVRTIGNTIIDTNRTKER